MQQLTNQGIAGQQHTTLQHSHDSQFKPVIPRSTTPREGFIDTTKDEYLTTVLTLYTAKDPTEFRKARTTFNKHKIKEGFENLFENILRNKLENKLNRNEINIGLVLNHIGLVEFNGNADDSKIRSILQVNRLEDLNTPYNSRGSDFDIKAVILNKGLTVLQLQPDEINKIKEAVKEALKEMKEIFQEANIIELEVQDFTVNTLTEIVKKKEEEEEEAPFLRMMLCTANDIPFRKKGPLAPLAPLAPFTEFKKELDTWADTLTKENTLQLLLDYHKKDRSLAQLEQDSQSLESVKLKNLLFADKLIECILLYDQTLVTEEIIKKALGIKKLVTGLRLYIENETLKKKTKSKSTPGATIRNEVIGNGNGDRDRDRNLSRSPSFKSRRTKALVSKMMKITYTIGAASQIPEDTLLKELDDTYKALLAAQPTMNLFKKVIKKAQKDYLEVYEYVESLIEKGDAEIRSVESVTVEPTQAPSNRWGCFSFLPCCLGIFKPKGSFFRSVKVQPVIQLRRVEIPTSE